MDANGQNLINLTNHKAEDGQPAWSPDNQKIAWISFRPGNGQLFVMDAADGGNSVELIGYAGVKRDPEWSPDGKRVAGVGFGGGRAVVFTSNPNGEGNWKEIPDIGFPNRSPAWFDPDFIPEFSVSPIKKRHLSWGWLKQARLGN
jgi:TolB protein